MTNNPMTEDRELDRWREQWSTVARPCPEFQRQVQKRVKAQDRRFWLGNLLAAAALVGMLILAVYQLNHQASRLEKPRQPACLCCCSCLLHVAYGLCGEHGVRKRDQFALSWSFRNEECWLKSGESKLAFTWQLDGSRFARRLPRLIGRPSRSILWPIPSRASH